jgi:hypothetical protein
VSEDLRPAEGARFLLEREAIEPDGGAARYRATIFTPDAEHRYGLALRDDGDAALSGGGVADADLETRLVEQARSIARAAARRRADGLPPWPERVLRWRGPGRG